jgi:hypothetical protein
MPVTPPAFKTGSGQPAFTTETQCGDYTVEYALGAAEPTALIIRAPFMETRADYARPAANSNITYGGSTAYFIDDLSFQDLRAGVAQWTREWATIPASWSEPEEYAYTYPAYLGSGGYVGYSVSAITASGANFILSISGGTIVAGDTVFYSLRFTRASVVYNVSGSAIAVATTNTSQVTITIGLAGTGSFSAVSGSVGLTMPIRQEPETKVVGSRVQSDYALSTAANLNADLPLVPAFSAIVVSGGTYGTLTDTLSTATAPTAANYIAMINAGSEIVAECTRRRYLGNIYVRRTRFVPAL